MAKLSDRAELVIGIYQPDVDAGVEWGYLFNVDHPHCSMWAPTEQIAGAIDPTDLPQIGELTALGLRVAFLADDTATADPQAVALALGKVVDRRYEARRLADLLAWLATFQAARMWSYTPDD